jgi:soluble lytic murein transglycosylase-like protein
MAALVVGALALGVSACTPEQQAAVTISATFGDHANEALAIAQCESSLNPNAVSRGNYGLFQINAVHKGLVASMGYSWDQILDPGVNTAVAKRLYDEQGWGPWSCKRVLS